MTGNIEDVPLSPEAYVVVLSGGITAIWPDEFGVRKPLYPTLLDAQIAAAQLPGAQIFALGREQCLTSPTKTGR